MTNSEFSLFGRRLKRKLAAILAADVVGFSKMMGENEDRTLRNLMACREINDGDQLGNIMKECLEQRVTVLLLNLPVLLMQYLQQSRFRKICAIETQ